MRNKNIGKLALIMIVLLNLTSCKRKIYIEYDYEKLPDIVQNIQSILENEDIGLYPIEMYTTNLSIDESSRVKYWLENIHYRRMNPILAFVDNKDTKNVLYLIIADFDGKYCMLENEDYYYPLNCISFESFKTINHSDKTIDIYLSTYGFDNLIASTK